MVIWQVANKEEYDKEGAGEFIWILCSEWRKRLFYHLIIPIWIR